LPTQAGPLKWWHPRGLDASQSTVLASPLSEFTDAMAGGIVEVGRGDCVTS
jgi:hypothetical protein